VEIDLTESASAFCDADSVKKLLRLERWKKPAISSSSRGRSWRRRRSSCPHDLQIHTQNSQDR